MIDRETSSASSAPTVEERLLLDYGVDTAKIMVRRVAHDFNNLIAVVRGYASVLQGRPGLDEDCRELVGLIEQAGCELAALTERMAQFADDREHEFSWINLNSVILEYFKEDRDQALQGIEVATDLVNPIPDIWGNARLIGDICQKLCQNAVDSMPDGGRLTIQTSLQRFDAAQEDGKSRLQHFDGGERNGQEHNENTNGTNVQDKSHTHGSGPATYLRLRVTDTGQGMDEKTRANILRPFFTTKAGKGRGMGATVVYEIVKFHGGHISVSSEPGNGTCVDIHLPVAERSQAQSLGEWDQSRKTQCPIVLVVDDDDMVRLTIQKMLAHLGYDTIPATSGEEALTLFEASREVISAVILDVTMPGLGGVGTFHGLRAIDTQVKIIIASGDMGSPAVKELRGSGISYLLSKPFPTEELSRAVQCALE